MYKQKKVFAIKVYIPGGTDILLASSTMPDGSSFVIEGETYKYEDFVKFPNIKVATSNKYGYQGLGSITVQVPDGSELSSSFSSVDINRRYEIFASIFVLNVGGTVLFKSGTKNYNYSSSVYNVGTLSVTFEDSLNKRMQADKLGLPFVGDPLYKEVYTDLTDTLNTPPSGETPDEVPVVNNYQHSDAYKYSTGLVYDNRFTKVYQPLPDISTYIMKSGASEAYREVFLIYSAYLTASEDKVLLNYKLIKQNNNDYYAYNNPENFNNIFDKVDEGQSILKSYSGYTIRDIGISCRHRNRYSGLTLSAPFDPTFTYYYYLYYFDVNLSIFLEKTSDGTLAVEILPLTINIDRSSAGSNEFLSSNFYNYWYNNSGAISSDLSEFSYADAKTVDWPNPETCIATGIISFPALTNNNSAIEPGEGCAARVIDVITNSNFVTSMSYNHNLRAKFQYYGDNQYTLNRILAFDITAYNTSFSEWRQVFYLFDLTTPAYTITLQNHSRVVITNNTVMATYVGEVAPKHFDGINDVAGRQSNIVDAYGVSVTNAAQTYNLSAVKILTAEVENGLLHAIEFTADLSGDLVWTHYPACWSYYASSYTNVIYNRLESGYDMFDTYDSNYYPHIRAYMQNDAYRKGYIVDGGNGLSIDNDIAQYPVLDVFVHQRGTNTAFNNNNLIGSLCFRSMKLDYLAYISGDRAYFELFSSSWNHTGNPINDYIFTLKDLSPGSSLWSPYVKMCNGNLIASADIIQNSTYIKKSETLIYTPNLAYNSVIDPYYGPLSLDNHLSRYMPDPLENRIDTEYFGAADFIDYVGYHPISSEKGFFFICKGPTTYVLDVDKWDGYSNTRSILTLGAGYSFGRFYRSRDQVGNLTIYQSYSNDSVTIVRTIDTAVPAYSSSFSVTISNPNVSSLAILSSTTVAYSVGISLYRNDITGAIYDCPETIVAICYSYTFDMYIVKSANNIYFVDRTNETLINSIPNTSNGNNLHIEGNVLGIYDDNGVSLSAYLLNENGGTYSAINIGSISPDIDFTQDVKNVSVLANGLMFAANTSVDRFILPRTSGTSSVSKLFSNLGIFQYNTSTNTLSSPSTELSNNLGLLASRLKIAKNEDDTGKRVATSIGTTKGVPMRLMLSDQNSLASGIVDRNGTEITDAYCQIFLLSRDFTYVNKVVDNTIEFKVYFPVVTAVRRNDKIVHKDEYMIFHTSQYSVEREALVLDTYVLFFAEQKTFSAASPTGGYYKLSADIIRTMPWLVKQDTQNTETLAFLTTETDDQGNTIGTTDNYLNILSSDILDACKYYTLFNDVILQMLMTYTKLSIEDINRSTFNYSYQSKDYIVGLNIESNDTVLNILNKLLKAYNGILYRNNLGKLELKVNHYYVEPFGIDTLAFEDLVKILNVRNKPRGTGLPSQYSLNYQLNNAGDTSNYQGKLVKISPIPEIAGYTSDIYDEGKEESSNVIVTPTMANIYLSRKIKEDMNSGSLIATVESLEDKDSLYTSYNIYDAIFLDLSKINSSLGTKKFIIIGKELIGGNSVRFECIEYSSDLYTLVV